ncbi:hypothetical protein [Paraburkholderia sediminicola]|uniref:hypothetical protein n=1 Tax=Paraburkholderia sediminicola TaxID=458836 RepID=UPI0038BBA6AA
MSLGPSANTEITTMRIFVDAEFYAERTDFDRHARSAFVCVAGVPRLGQYPEPIFSRTSLQPVLHNWLARLRGAAFGMDFTPSSAVGSRRYFYRSVDINLIV